MCRFYFLGFFSFISGFIYSQGFDIGPTLQKTHTLYWENGISAQYSFEKFKPKQFYLGAEFLSSSLGTAMGSNALDQHHYTLYGAWLSNADKPWHISSKLKLGYFSVDLEEEIFKDLPNSSIYISPEIGLAYDLPKLPIRVNLGLGYIVDFTVGGSSPGSLQPLHYNLRLLYQL